VFSTRDSALDWFDAERESLVASVFLAHEEDFLDYAAELPHRLARYLDLRRLFTDWEATMRISHAILDGSGYVEFEAGALDSLGMVARELHRYADSVDHHRRAVAQARESGDERLLARFLNNMGLALFQLRSYDEALAAHDEAADIFQRHGDHLGFARAIDNSASALRELGILDEALQRHEKAIAECKERGAVETAARISTHLGNTLHDMGRYADAVTAHEESVAALKKLRLLNEAAHALNNLANSLRGAGRLDEAVLAVNESVALHVLTDDRVGQARALNQAGLIHMARLEYEPAEERLREALEAVQGTPDSIDAAYAHANLGQLYALTGRPEAGMEQLQIAARLFSALER
jgi:tetratricopeptide (TPR) repeat protein